MRTPIYMPIWCLLVVLITMPVYAQTGPPAGRAKVSPRAAGAPSAGTLWVAPGDPIPSRQWVERPGPVPSDNCNFASDSGSIWNVEICSGFPPSKHMRMFYHPPSRSMVIAGGDRPVAMPHPQYYDATGSEIDALNVAENTWRILRPFCVPGEPQPNRPDNVTWVYDSKRDRGIMAPGYYFMIGSGCGAVEGWGGYAFDFATKKYIGPNEVAGLPQPPEGGGGGGWGGDNGASFGVYDPVGDELIRLRTGPRMERLNLQTRAWRIQELSIGAPWNPNPNRAQSVIDVQGRAAYWVDAWGDKTPSLAKISLKDGRVTRIPLPPQWVPIEGLAGDVYLAFDPGNRVLLIPNSFGMGGTPLSGLGIFHVDTGVWEWDAVPPAVYGSAWGFDENLGVLVGIGKRQQPYAYYIWKYGPKAQ